MSTQTLEQYLEDEKARQRTSDLERLRSGQATPDQLQQENSLWPRTATSKVDYQEYAARVLSRRRVGNRDKRDKN